MHLSLISRAGDCQQTKFFAQRFAVVVPLRPDWGKNRLLRHSHVIMIAVSAAACGDGGPREIFVIAAFGSSSSSS